MCKLHTCVCMCMHVLYICMYVCMAQIIVVEKFCNFHNYMIIMKIIVTKIFIHHVINIGNRSFNLVVSSSTSGQVLCSAMIITVFTSAACHSDNSEGNGSYLQPTLSVDFHPIYVSTDTLLSQPVIYSIVLDTVPSS